MYMRSTKARDAVLRGTADAAQAGLCIDAVSDVLAGSAAQWWRHDHPEYGWVALALLVAAVDATGSKTMSDCFRTASRHPIARPVVAVGWGVLTAHLFGLIPPQYDPFHQLTALRPAHDRP
jgi:hypothetical protein